MPGHFLSKLLAFVMLVALFGPAQVAAGSGTLTAGQIPPKAPQMPTGGIVGNGTQASCTEDVWLAVMVAGGTVTFSCGGPKTIPLTSITPIFTDTTVFGGDVITLTGGLSTRLFSVPSGVTLRLQHIVLDGGASTGSGGGAISSHGNLWLENSTIQNSQTNNNGGAIFSDGPVTITNSLLKNNTAGNGGALSADVVNALVTISNSTFSGNQAVNKFDGFGGAILVGLGTQVSITGGAIISNGARSGGGLYLNADGVVTLTSPGAPALVSGNVATQAGGGLYNNLGTITVMNVTLSGNLAPDGGGIYDRGMLTVTNSTLSSNLALDGGGILDDGTLTVINSTLSGNVAKLLGGGIYNRGTLSLTNATLSGNATGSGGGGIYNNAMLIVTNSTFSGNSAIGSGGGLDNAGAATLTNATLSGNTAAHGGGMHQYATLYLTQTITLSNTILAGGLSGANCDADLGASFVSNGYNFSSDATCTSYFTQPSDLNSELRNLGPLANNGGPTLTHMPIPPSKAIDAIPRGANGCGTTLTTDQRGAPRPINGKCDIGAVEYGWIYAQLWLPLIRR